MLSIPNPIRSAAMTQPHKIALLCGNKRLTWKQVDNRVANIAAYLWNRGVRPGHIVGLLGVADLEWVLSFFAINWLGAIAAPLDPNDPHKLCHAKIRAAKAKFILTTTRSPQKKAFSKSKEIALRDINTTSRLAERPWVLSETVLAISTSGTTGQPKWVQLKAQQLFFGAMGSTLRLGHLTNDRWLCCVPLFHIAGAAILWRAAWSATSVLLQQPFSTTEVAAVLKRGDVTLASLVPTMLQKIFDHNPNFRVAHNVRAILVGGSPMSLGLFKQCQRQKLPLAITWGMTETAAQVATRFPGDLSWPLDCGPALPFCRISHDSQNLVIHGPQTRTGRYVTKDRGIVDKKHRVRVTGRSDSLLISGGKKISTAEIQHILLLYPKIEDAVVLGVSDRVLGKKIVAAFVTRQHITIEARTLWSFCANKLGLSKTPRAFAHFSAFPQTASGKIDQKKIVEFLSDKLQASQPIQEFGRNRARLKRRSIDNRVHMFDFRAQNITVKNAERQRYGRAAQALDLQTNRQTVSHARRSKIIRFSVDQRRTPRTVLKKGLARTKDLGHQLFVGDVTIFKKTRKKNNSRAIDFKKSHNHLMFKSHSNSLHKEVNL